MLTTVASGFSDGIGIVTDGVQKGLGTVADGVKDVMDGVMEVPAALAGTRSRDTVDKKFICRDRVFKLTTNPDLVVERTMYLFPDRIYTYHNENTDKPHRWFLHYKDCQLIPADAKDLESFRARKVVRPQGTSTIKAMVTGRGEEVQLYMIQLQWSRRWAVKGHSYFAFGCKDLQTAREWHRMLRAQLEELRHQKQQQQQEQQQQQQQHGHGKERPVGEASPSKVQQQGGTSFTAATVDVRAVSGKGGSDGAQGTPPSFLLANPSAAVSVGESREGSLNPSAGAQSVYFDPAGSMPSTLELSPTEQLEGGGSPHASQMPADSDEEEYQQPVQDLTSMTKRWVPYKQVNGLSIYYHMHESDDTSVGGEYMVSTVVRGRPKQVLDVLMHGTTNTTILGPARTVEVLECSQLDDNTTKELVRLIIEAPGWAGVFCAPREVVVERQCRMDTSCYTVMFTSSADLVLRSKALRKCAKPNEAGGQGPAMQTLEVQEAAEGQHMRRSLWRRPVQGSVFGAYNISCLRGYNLNNSPESLVTCMVKVDLKGACAASSWSGVLCDLFGWRDAFLDRILMNVMLVRDEVEQRQFKVLPQELLSETVNGTTTAKQPLSPGAEPSGPTLNRISGTSRDIARSRMASRGASRIIQRGASSVTQRSASQAAAAAALGAGGKSAVPLPGVQPVSGGLPVMPEDVVPGLDTSMPVVGEEGEETLAMASEGSASEGERGAVLDLELMAQLSTLPKAYWSELHREGTDAPFVVRGPTYLTDRKKLPAGEVEYVFAAMDMIELPYPVEHVARFLPSIRSTGVPFAIIVNLIIPGTPLLGIVATFATDKHPKDALRNRPMDEMEEGHNWKPFDFALYEFYHGTPEQRNKMLKLIPHIAEGSWMIRSSVGTTPVILGKALKTTYYETPQYLEIDIDISANNVAAYVTGLVRGATKSLVIDMGFVLEGTTPWMLPEKLLGALRLHRLDLKMAKKIDTSKELPLVPPQYITSVLGQEGYASDANSQQGGEASPRISRPNMPGGPFAVARDANSGRTTPTPTASAADGSTVAGTGRSPGLTSAGSSQIGSGLPSAPPMASPSRKVPAASASAAAVASPSRMAPSPSTGALPPSSTTTITASALPHIASAGGIIASPGDSTQTGLRSRIPRAADAAGAASPAAPRSSNTLR